MSGLLPALHALAKLRLFVAANACWPAAAAAALVPGLEPPVVPGLLEPPVAGRWWCLGDLSVGEN